MDPLKKLVTIVIMFGGGAGLALFILNNSKQIIRKDKLENTAKYNEVVIRTNKEIRSTEKTANYVTRHVDETTMENTVKYDIGWMDMGHLPPVYTYNSKWEINENVCKLYFNNTQFLDKRKFQIHHLKFNDKYIPIFTHEPSQDMISRFVAQNASFEQHIDKTIEKFMTIYPEAILIDIGANIGVRTMQALQNGKRVIAVEATESSVQHLCLSSIIAKLSSNLTIVHNAVTDKHGYVQFATGKGGQGGNFVADSTELLSLKKQWDGISMYKEKTNEIPSMIFDDLLDLPKIKQVHDVFIKLDVEGLEDKVLQRSENVFRKWNVIGLILEWRWHKPRNSSQTIINVMNKFHFLPFTLQQESLNVSSYLQWPEDILWLPEKLPNYITNILLEK